MCGERTKSSIPNSSCHYHCAFLLFKREALFFTYLPQFNKPEHEFINRDKMPAMMYHTFYSMEQSWMWNVDHNNKDELARSYNQIYIFTIVVLNHFTNAFITFYWTTYLIKNWKYNACQLCSGFWTLFHNYHNHYRFLLSTCRYIKIRMSSWYFQRYDRP